MAAMLHPPPAVAPRATRRRHDRTHPAPGGIWESWSMRRLLLVDPGGRVALGDVDSQAIRHLGDDHESAATGPRGHVRSTVWSPAGQWAAYALDSEELDGPREVRVHEVGPHSDRVLATALTAFYLCPSPCGRYLSHLSPGPLGLELAVSEIATGELRVIERGQPLFWSWSPDSSEIAVHVANRALVAPTDGGPSRLLTEDAGSFLAPWWLPDGSVAIVTGDQIVAHAPDGAITALAAPVAGGRFALDPAGRRLAFVDLVHDIACLIALD